MAYDNTIAIVLDKQHAKEFSLVYPGWLKHHPYLTDCHWLFVALDPVTWPVIRTFSAELPVQRFVQVLDDRRQWPMPPEPASIRDIALWQYLTTVPLNVRTSRWTKIDTDVVARPHDSSSATLALGSGSVVTGSAWGYTKPAGALGQLARWVRQRWPKSVPPTWKANDNKDKCRRLIGWLSSHDTAFTQEIARACLEQPPPVISHDTLTWLVAESTGRQWGDYPYKLLGWEHVRPRSIPERVAADAQPVGMSNHAKRVIDLIERIDAKRVAEVGVYRGETSAAILRNCPNVHLLMVDQWTSVTAGDYLQTGDQRARDTQAGHDRAREIAYALTDSWSARRSIAPIASLQAASLEAACRSIGTGQQLDLVFIDAAHDYHSVVDDIAAWAPLVRPGGILCGHDFGHRRFGGVQQAVREFVEPRGLDLTVDKHSTVWWVTMPALVAVN